VKSAGFHIIGFRPVGDLARAFPGDERDENVVVCVCATAEAATDRRRWAERMTDGCWLLCVPGFLGGVCGF
jgi:hypothetical protein